MIIDKLKFVEHLRTGLERNRLGCLDSKRGRLRSSRLQNYLGWKQ